MTLPVARTGPEVVVGTGVVGAGVVGVVGVVGAGEAGTGKTLEPAGTEGSLVTTRVAVDPRALMVGSALMAAKIWAAVTPDLAFLVTMVMVNVLWRSERREVCGTQRAELSDGDAAGRKMFWKMSRDVSGYVG